jgi:hypothetical protein
MVIGMSKSFTKILDIEKKYREDGYEVTAMRVDEDTWNSILKNDGLIRRSNSDFDFNFENEESVGVIGNIEIIPDDSISDPVPDDIRGMWRNE